MLGWTPDRLNRALRVTKDRGHLRVEGGAGSAPFIARGFHLSEEGWLHCEKQRLGVDSSPLDKGTTLMPENRKQVFIIHGRNAAARIAAEQFLRALGLEPVDFDQLAADLPGKFIGDIVLEGLRRASGIVALFTPDEYAALLPSFEAGDDLDEDRQGWQVRLNVMFEAGIAFAIAKDRDAIAIVGDVRLPSDIK